MEVRKKYVLHISKLFSGGPGYFLALPAARDARDPRVHHGAHKDSGRAPCHASWLLAKRLRSAPLTRAGPWKTQNVSLFLVLSAVTSAVVPHRASNALHFEPATVQQEPSFKIFISDSHKRCFFLRVLFTLNRSFHPSTCSKTCLLYTSPSPRDKRQSRMPSSA